jgi:hypothetical protein
MLAFGPTRVGTNADEREAVQPVEARIEIDRFGTSVLRDRLLCPGGRGGGRISVEDEAAGYGEKDHRPHEQESAAAANVIPLSEAPSIDREREQPADEKDEAEPGTNAREKPSKRAGD